MPKPYQATKGWNDAYIRAPGRGRVLRVGVRTPAHGCAICGRPSFRLCCCSTCWERHRQLTELKQAVQSPSASA